MAADRLPNEIWLHIFKLSTLEYLPNRRPPNSMDESAWFKHVLDAWRLQSPDELAMNAQKKRYNTVKAILSTCKRWHSIAGEFLFSHIAVFRPTLLHSLCRVLDNEPHLGTYATSIYLGGSSEPQGESLAILVSIIRRCPNVDTMIITWPLSPTYSAAIADALLSFTSKKVQTLRWNMSSSAQSRVIWALNALRKSLTSLDLQFGAPTGEDNLLGSAGNLNLTLPHLQTLSLRGSFQDFLEQCTDWSLPALQHVTLDNSLSPHDFPLVDEFCVQHGTNLTYLDIDCLQTIDVAAILDLCPNLTTFLFNGDWHFPPSDERPMESKLTNSPHPNISTIGVHQLLCAFGLVYTTPDSFKIEFRQRSNDMNFSALNKHNFPKLQCVRITNRGLLRALESNNGPTQHGLSRWERWWDQCARQNVRLEDCTGSLLGTLPQDEPESDESEEEGDDDEEEDESEEYDDESEDDETEGDWQMENRAPTIQELRDLLEECRRMSSEADRDVPVDLELFAALQM